MGVWLQWAPTIVAVVTALLMIGQLTGRIKDQEKTLARHDEKLDDHDELLGTHAVAIAEGKAWREGYNARSGELR